MVIKCQDIPLRAYKSGEKGNASTEVLPLDQGGEGSRVFRDEKRSEEKMPGRSRSALGHNSVLVFLACCSM